MIQLPGEDTILALSQRDVSTLLALAILLACLAFVVWLIVMDRAGQRRASEAAAKAKSEEKETDGETSQVLELTRVMAMVVKTNSDTADALREATAEQKEANRISRELITLTREQEAEHEKIIRSVVGTALEAVMTKLTSVEGQLRGPILTKQIEELREDVARIMAVLNEQNGQLLPAINALKASQTVQGGQAVLIPPLEVKPTDTPP